MTGHHWTKEKTSIHTLRISRKYWRDGASRKFSPSIGGRIVELAVLATCASTPRCSYREQIASGASRLRLIATGDVQVLGDVEISDGFLCKAPDPVGSKRQEKAYRQSNPIIGRLLVSTRGRIGVPASSNNPSSEVQRQSFAKHIMIYIGDYGLCDRLGRRIVGGSISSCAWGAPKAAGSVGRPSEQRSSGVFMRYRDRYEGHIDRQGPRTLSNRRWRRGKGRSINVELCRGGPGPSASGFGKGDDTNIPSGEGGEGCRLEGGIINICPDGYCCEGDAVRAIYERDKRGSTKAPQGLAYLSSIICSPIRPLEFPSCLGR